MPYHHSTTPDPYYQEWATTPGPYVTTPGPYVTTPGPYVTTTTTPAPKEDCCTPTVLAKYGPNDIIPAGPQKGKLFRIGFPAWEAGDWWWGDKDNNIFTENNIDTARPPAGMVISVTFRKCFKLNPAAKVELQGGGTISALQRYGKMVPGGPEQRRAGKGGAQNLLWLPCECCPEKDWRPVAKPPPPAKPTEPKPTEPKKPTEPTPTEPKPTDPKKPTEPEKGKPGGGAGPSDDEMERKRLEEAEDKRFEERKRKAEEEDRKRAEMAEQPDPRPDDVIPPKGGKGLGGKVPPVGGGAIGPCCEPEGYWWVCPPISVPGGGKLVGWNRAHRPPRPIYGGGTFNVDNWLWSLVVTRTAPGMSRISRFSKSGVEAAVSAANLDGTVIVHCHQGYTGVAGEGFQDPNAALGGKAMVQRKPFTIPAGCKCYKVKEGKSDLVKQWPGVPPSAPGGYYLNPPSPAGSEMWEECKCCDNYKIRLSTQKKYYRLGLVNNGKGGVIKPETIQVVLRNKGAPPRIGVVTKSIGGGEVVKGANYHCP